MSDEHNQEEGGGNSAPSWKELFKLRGDLRQRDVYAFELNVNLLGGFSRDGSNILAAHALKAAIEAGWIADQSSEVLKTSGGEKRYYVAGEDVDDMHPGKVRWYGLKVVAHYTEAVTPPPN